MAEKAIKDSLFAWEGADKKGARIKGETRGNNISLIKADLRRHAEFVEKALRQPRRSAPGEQMRGLCKECRIARTDRRHVPHHP